MLKRWIWVYKCNSKRPASRLQKPNTTFVNCKSGKRRFRIYLSKSTNKNFKIY